MAKKSGLQKWIGQGSLALPLLALGACSNFSTENIHERLVESAVRIDAPESGSGVIFKREGDEYWVVTAAHSVDGKSEDGTELDVQTSVMVTADGQIWTISPTQKSFIPDTDLAVLRFESNRDYPVVKLGKSEELQRGQEIIVVGSPMTTPERPNREVLTTEGKVIGFGQQVLGYGISYDAVAQPGMSGAGVFDQKGRLVAIHGQGVNQNGGRFSGGMPISLLNKLPIPIEVDRLPEKTAQDWFDEGLARDSTDYEGKISDYDKALEIKPDYHEAWYNRGNALEDLERYEEAIASYDKAVEIKPDYYEAWENRGHVLEGLERFEEALASYDKALEIRPDYYEAWENRGNVLERLGRFEKALTSYDKALEIRPDYYEAWENRAYPLERLGRFEEALISYDKALEINPYNDYTWRYRGNALDALGRFEEALISYDKALEINPDYDRTWNDRGNALDALGRYREAIDSYNKALAIDPNWKTARNNKERVAGKLGL